MISPIQKNFFKHKYLFFFDIFFFDLNFLFKAKNQRTLLVFISTYEDATPPPSAKWFFLHLQEAATDFRVSKNELEKLTYAVFGCGNSLYNENFNKVKSSNFER
jgi:tRNA wybutosine-synthesizing protein 1